MEGFPPETKAWNAATGRNYNCHCLGRFPLTFHCRLIGTPITCHANHRRFADIVSALMAASCSACCRACASRFVSRRSLPCLSILHSRHNWYFCPLPTEYFHLLPRPSSTTTATNCRCNSNGLLPSLLLLPVSCESFPVGQRLVVADRGYYPGHRERGQSARSRA